MVVLVLSCVCGVRFVLTALILALSFRSRSYSCSLNFDVACKTLCCLSDVAAAAEETVKAVFQAQTVGGRSSNSRTVRPSVGPGQSHLILPRRPVVYWTVNHEVSCSYSSSTSSNSSLTLNAACCSAAHSQLSSYKNPALFGFRSHRHHHHDT